MARAPFQGLVIPYWIRDDGSIRYALFRRTEDEGGYWQFIAGGGEGQESPTEAAKREACEEAAIPLDATYSKLSSVATIPVVHVSGFEWGPDVLVIPEYSFGVKTESSQLRLSNEHVEYAWLRVTVAQHLVRWDSNRSALWELNHRLTAMDQRA